MSVRATEPQDRPSMPGWPDAPCSYCDEMGADVDRLRAERNALLVRVHELEQEIQRPRRPDRAVGRTRRRNSRAPLMPATAHRHSQSLPAMEPIPPLDATPRGGPLPFTPPQPSARIDGVPSLPIGGVMSAGQGLDFGAVSRLNPDELDGLPYGLITLDTEGRVINYNDTEARLAGLPVDRVVGRSFFDEVAPCTRVREFEGRFRELAQDPSAVRVQSFDFVFRFAHSEQHVSIVMTPARRRGHFHLALVRRSIAAR